jgi:2-amino-4-hydroxy-6-hydroxymethyldihydropteridine diphosphokinase
VDYWVGLGSNVGDGQALILSALARLGAVPGIRVRRRSHCYLSPPWGRRNQADFTNAVALLESELAPGEMLDRLLAVESSLGRERGAVRWGPRTMDLDLLLAADRILRLEGLTVPHPRLHRRAFVLVPGRGRVRDLLARLSAHSVRRTGDS